jgi:TetR/AcrR family transcriptional repressor of nem operon
MSKSLLDPAGAADTEASATRLSILRTARELIQMRSYLGLSFQELANRVGIRKASLYHHFASKEALGIAVFERGTHQFDVWVASMGGSPRQQLRAYINMFRDVLGAGQRVCPGGAMGPGWDCIEPNLQNAVRQMRQGQIDWLTLTISQIKLGKAATAMTPAQTASQLFALCQGALLSARITGRAADFDDALCPFIAQWQLDPLH